MQANLRLNLGQLFGILFRGGRHVGDVIISEDNSKILINIEAQRLFDLFIYRFQATWRSCCHPASTEARGSFKQCAKLSRSWTNEDSTTEWIARKFWRPPLQLAQLVLSVWSHRIAPHAPFSISNLIWETSDANRIIITHSCYWFKLIDNTHTNI